MTDFTELTQSEISAVVTAARIRRVRPFDGKE